MSQPLTKKRSRPLKTHLLKRFGQRVTACATVSNNVRPPIVSNNPTEVTCKACLHLHAKGHT